MPRKPLAGRRIWFVGIGGAGLSGYALLARAWGAEVGGWDRVDTPYLRHLGDVPVELAPEPVVPALDFSGSWALGWLTSNTALVAAASQGEECGPRRSGIYVVDRRYPAFLQLVATTPARDATTWGR